MPFVDSSPCRYCNYPNEQEYLCDPASANVCEPCRKLSELEQKVKEIRMMLVGLESERQKLKEQANHHHDKLIHRLPPEIAGQIFNLCLPADFLKSNLEALPRVTVCAPLIISGVCRTWREIAHSTPQLWTAIPITSWKHLPGIYLFEKWIKRSGQLPVSIVFYTIYGKNTTRILNMLKKYSNRVSGLRFEGDLSTFTQLSSSLQDLPNLRTLYLTAAYPERRPSTIPIHINSEQLNSLTLTGVLLSSVTLDWNFLTALTMKFIMLSEIFEALRRAPNLVYGCFLWSRDSYGDTMDKRFSDPSGILVHREMQTLCVSNPHCNLIFKHLSCPSLKGLAIDPNNQSFEMGPVINFLRTSGCSLEKLAFWSPIYTHEEGTISLTICKEIPTLLCLYLKHEKSPEALYACLGEFSDVDGRETPRYLPKLHTLRIQHKDGMKDWQMVPNIFGALSAKPTKCHRPALKNVNIFAHQEERYRNLDNDDVGEDAMKRILQLRDAGVQWKILFGEGTRYEKNVLWPAVER